MRKGFDFQNFQA
jgi:hypothetical protein